MAPEIWRAYCRRDVPRAGGFDGGDATVLALGYRRRFLAAPAPTAERHLCRLRLRPPRHARLLSRVRHTDLDGATRMTRRLLNFLVLAVAIAAVGCSRRPVAREGRTVIRETSQERAASLAARIRNADVKWDGTTLGLTPRVV